MALIECPDCSKAVSENSSACPSCGFMFVSEKYGRRPGKFCKRCGHDKIVKKKGVYGFLEITTFVVLAMFWFIPAIAFYFYAQSKPCCAKCGKRRW